VPATVLLTWMVGGWRHSGTNEKTVIVALQTRGISGQFPLVVFLQACLLPSLMALVYSVRSAVYENRQAHQDMDDGLLTRNISAPPGLCCTAWEQPHRLTVRADLLSAWDDEIALDR
jgi:hypothetical protein